MTRGVIQPERSPQVTDLLIRQKAEVMILWAYTALRQFPKWERHVLAAEIRRTLLGELAFTREARHVV